jgi:hypothetical protein
VDPSVGFVLAPLLPVKDHFLSRPKAFQKLPRLLLGINGHTGLNTAFLRFAISIVGFTTHGVFWSSSVSALHPRRILYSSWLIFLILVGPTRCLECRTMVSSLQVLLEKRNTDAIMHSGASHKIPVLLSMKLSDIFLSVK